MSGPKRGIWYIPYDPTPARLDDLSRFVTKQDAWLDRHAPFIKHNLGSNAFARAQAARDLVDEYIEAGDPDGGFDAYGDAWYLLNQLYREAMDAKRKRKQQERLRRQQQQQERYERLKRQQAAARLFAECKTVWQDSENQALLKRWTGRTELRNLTTALETLAACAPGQVQHKASAWQKRFEYILDTAVKRARQNSKQVQEWAPRVQGVIRDLGGLNITVLTNEEQTHFKAEKNQLQQTTEYALSNEVLEELHTAFDKLKNLETEYSTKIKTAQFQKATEIVRQALAKCGYSVASRTEADGSKILRASGFPLKSLSVEMNPDTDEMKLNVKGKEHCVEDIKSLQAELAGQGLVLTMTDWGMGKPQNIHKYSQQNISIGGAE